MKTAHFLEVSGVSRKKGDAFLLKPISFSVDRGSRLAIIGATGSGKSTLLRIIAGLEPRDSGMVFLEGAAVLGPHEQLMPGHPSIAYLSQHFELRNHYRVEEELDYTNVLPAEKAGAIFRICKIEHILRRWTTEISGGERQRVALARMLVRSPRLLLLDEPFSNLDAAHKSLMKEVIRETSEVFGITTLLVAHEPADLLPWADRLLVMQDGAAVQEGSPEEIYTNPASAYTAALLGPVSIISKKLQQHLRIHHSFLRPEWLRLEKIHASHAMGSVTAIYYHGAHDEVEVQVEGEKLLGRSTRGQFLVGDAVHISVVGP